MKVSVVVDAEFTPRCPDTPPSFAVCQGAFVAGVWAAMAEIERTGLIAAIERDGVLVNASADIRILGVRPNATGVTFKEGA